MKTVPRKLNIELVWWQDIISIGVLFNAKVRLLFARILVLCILGWPIEIEGRLLFSQTFIVRRDLITVNLFLLLVASGPVENY